MMKCYGDGKVDTSPGVGTSYYHLKYLDSFVHDFLLSL
jgi:hypothetical protein